MKECNCDQALALKAWNERIIEEIKNCFLLPGCTDGVQIVSNANYNKLAAVINENLNN